MILREAKQLFTVLTKMSVKTDRSAELCVSFACSHYFVFIFFLCSVVFKCDSLFESSCSKCTAILLDCILVKMEKPLKHTDPQVTLKLPTKAQRNGFL